MGRKTVYFAMASSVLSGFVSLICMFLPFNALTFYAGGIAVIGSLRIKLLTANFDLTRNDVCNTIGKFVKNLEFCHEMRGDHDLQYIAHRFCAPLVDYGIRGSCKAFSSCYALGLGTVILSVINLICQGVAGWMIYHYLTVSPKKKYRQVAFILCCCGTFLLATILALWFAMVSLPMDSISVIPPLNLAFSTSQGWSTSIGYWLLWCVLIIQVIQIALYGYGKVSDEARLVEAKMQEEFEAELAMTGCGGGDPYGGGYNDGAYNGGMPPSAGYAQNPYGAQPTGNYQYPPQSYPQPGQGAYQPQQMPPSWGNIPASMPPMPQQGPPGYGGY